MKMNAQKEHRRKRRMEERDMSIFKSIGIGKLRETEGDRIH